MLRLTCLIKMYIFVETTEYLNLSPVVRLPVLPKFLSLFNPTKLLKNICKSTKIFLVTFIGYMKIGCYHYMKNFSNFTDISITVQWQWLSLNLFLWSEGHLSLHLKSIIIYNIRQILNYNYNSQICCEAAETVETFLGENRFSGKQKFLNVI